MMIVFVVIAVMFLFLFYRLPTVEDDEEGRRDPSISPPAVWSPVVASTGNDIIVEVHEGLCCQLKYTS